MLMISMAFIAGFSGYLMIGNINLSVLELSTEGKRTQLVQFIFVTLLFEILYSFFTLYVLQLLMDYPMVVMIAQYATIAFLFFIGFWSLLEKKVSEQKIHQNIVKRGYWSVIVHPQQISFWFFWGIILMQKGVLKQDALSIATFSFINTLGAFAMLICYSLFGNKLKDLLRLNFVQLKNIVGVFCILSAIYLLYDILSA